jgi:hypothetical protein
MRCGPNGDRIEPLYLRFPFDFKLLEPRWREHEYQFTLGVGFFVVLGTDDR